MGTRLLRGRDFDRSDSSGAVVVNETMARQIWGNPDAAVGKVFRMDGIDCRVVGVVEDGKYTSLEEEPMPFLFRATPLAKRGEGTLLIQTAPAPTAMAGTIRKAIHDTDPGAFVMSLLSLRQIHAASLFSLTASPLGLIGAIAMLGDISGWRRTVRARFLWGQPAYPRNRNSSGDGSQTSGRASARVPAGGAASGPRGSDWARRGAGGGTGHEGGTLPGEVSPDRPDGARRRCGGGSCGRIARHLRSRTPGLAGRPG